MYATCRRKDICALLEEKRKAKFGKENSEGFGEGLSDPADAPREFDSIGSDRITFSEDKVITVSVYNILSSVCNSSKVTGVVNWGGYYNLWEYPPLGEFDFYQPPNGGVHPPPPQ